MVATIIISLIVAAILAAVIVKIVKNKKAGKHSCGCGCGGCAMKDCCHTDGEGAKPTPPTTSQN